MRRAAGDALSHVSETPDVALAYFKKCVWGLHCIFFLDKWNIFW
jgi:hypothetical protein